MPETEGGRTALNGPPDRDLAASLSIRELVRDTNLGLQVVGRTDVSDRSISWVYVSELPNPGPWLDGGELVLTLATWLRSGRISADEYVQRLVENGAGALAVLTGPEGGDLTLYPEVPRELVAAADAHSLPLLEVPGEVTFLAVTKTIAYALASRTVAMLSKAVDAQELLAREAVGDGGLAGVAARLQRTCGAWVLILGPAGEVLNATQPLAPARLRAVVADLGNVSRHAASTVIPLVSDGDSVVAYRLEVGDRFHGHLVIGRPTPLTTSQRRVASVAVGLCALLLDRDEAELAVAARLRDQHAAALLAGDAEEATRLGALLRVPTAAGPVVALALDSTLPGEAARTAAFRFARRALGRAVLASSAPHRLLLVRSDAGAVAQLLEPTLEAVPDLVAGIAPPSAIPELPAARRRAEAALADALRRGTRVVDLATVSRRRLVELIPDAEAAAFSDRVLEPLRRYDDKHRSDLVGTLHCWLAHFGQWEPTALDLGVHRNTLRHRIARVEEILATNLDSPAVRTDLWIALEIAAESR